MPSFKNARLESEASENITSFYLKETWRHPKTVMKNSFSLYLITVLAGEQIKLLELVPLFERYLVCVESERIIIFICT